MTRNTANRLLGALVLDANTLEAVLGDLEEERIQIASEWGDEAADAWYVRQVVRSVPSLLIRNLKQAPAELCRAAGPVFMGYAIMILVSIVIQESLLAVFPDGMSTSDLAFRILPVFAGTIAGGFATALSDRRRVLRSAVLLGCSLFGFGVANMSGHNPGVLDLAYFTALMMILMPAAVIGGWLRLRAAGIRR